MNTAENKRVLAGNIKYYMERKGVTKQQVCADLDLKYTTFVEWLKAGAYPRIGAVEKLAQYFGCEKKDLIEDWRGKDPEDDGLSEKQRILIDYIRSIPEDKQDLALRVMLSLAEEPLGGK